jgi:REP element-mobilizing transposase RayT
MSYNNLRKGRHSQSGCVYHVVAVTQNREPHFAVVENGRKVVRQLIELQLAKQAETLCYVVMPDHLHWLMMLQEENLSDVMRRLKARSAQAIGHTVWQANYFDHAVREDEDLKKMARYIVANPLRAKLVERIGDYSLWDAVWLEDTLSG